MLDFVRRTIASRGLSQLAVAKRAGLSPSTLSRILAGSTSTPHPHTLERLCRVVSEWESTAPTPTPAHERIAAHLEFVRTWATSVPAVRNDCSTTSILEHFVDLEFERQSDRRPRDKQINRVSNLIDIPGNFLLVGGAGAGKSTSLKLLALLALARAEVTSQGYPIVVRIRDVGLSGGLSEILLAALGISAAESAGNNRWELLIGVLDSLRAIVLLDGLDESSGDIAAPVMRELSYLALRANKFRLIVTSRRVENTERMENIELIQMLHLSNVNVRRFVDLWLHGSDRERFLLAMNSSPFVDWFTRPLILISLLELYRRYGTLPDRRSELYWETIQHLLEMDDWRFDNRLNACVRWMPIRSRVSLLGALAYSSLLDGREAGFSRTQFVRLYSSQYRELGLQKWDGELLLRELANRAGVIRESGIGRYQFMHRSLQEYLAAHYVSELDSPPGDLLLRFPLEAAIAVGLAETPDSLLWTLLSPAFEKNWDESTLLALEIFLRRVKEEDPEFEGSVHLGWSMLSLYSYAANYHTDIAQSVRQLVVSIIHNTPVRRSVYELCTAAEHSPDTKEFVLRASVLKRLSTSAEPHVNSFRDLWVDAAFVTRIRECSSNRSAGDCIQSQLDLNE